MLQQQRKRATLGEGACAQTHVAAEKHWNGDSNAVAVASRSAIK
jgi:hypothetical protein